MAALDKVSMRLMKPAKDLADWNFPLATILEEYYTLLSEQGDVNFSNAALVLQNSANVYVRRVEYLYHDTSSLNESFAEDRTSDKTKGDTKKSDKSKHTLIDFGDFETLDFTKLVGRNNNIKARTGTADSVKLLSQRFPELENVSRSSLPIEVYDIHGEVVGKKYDFRCNEHLTASGMLVRYLTPKDFLETCSDRSENIATESPLSDEHFATLEPNVSVEYADGGIYERSLCERTFEESCVVHEKDTGLLDTSFSSSIDSGLGSSIHCSNIRSGSSLSNFAGDQWVQSSRPGSSLSIADENNLAVGDSVTQNVSHTEKRGIDAVQGDDASCNDRRTEGREDTNDCTAGSDLQAGSTLESDRESVVPNVRRCKRLKNVIDAVNDLNPKVWEPIPFNDVPDKPRRIRTEFKLPCPISLLTFREKPRKRKITLDMRKRRRLERLSTIEHGTARNKMTMYSPTRQLFLPFKKEELEDSHLYVEKHLKNRTNLDRFSYEAVTNVSMDLLGFRTQVGKADTEMIAHVESVFQINVQEPDSDVRETVSSTNYFMEQNEPTEPLVDDFPMPDTPESSDSSSEEETPASAPLSAHHTRIEQSIRDIYDSAAMRTAQEEAVARWHEFMKPRLREAERRPPFDISDYGARVLQSMNSKNDRKIEFKEVVEHHESTEVARYFLASLQLANKYHIHIDTRCNVDGNFTIVLLDKDRSGQS